MSLLRLLEAHGDGFVNLTQLKLTLKECLNEGLSRSGWLWLCLSGVVLTALVDVGHPA